MQQHCFHAHQHLNMSLNGSQRSSFLKGAAVAIGLILAYILGATLHGAVVHPGAAPALIHSPKTCVKEGLVELQSVLTHGTEGLHMSPEEFREFAKVRQQMFCKDAVSLDIPTPGYATPLNDTVNSVLLKIDPAPVFLNVYGGAQDIVSKQLLQGPGVQWEGGELAQIMWAMRAPIPGAPNVFVDIGANVGAFTFNVAAAGFPVIAIEGLSHNVRLLRTAFCFSGAAIQEKVTIHPYGMGASRTSCVIVSGKTNRGDGIAVCGKDIANHELVKHPDYLVRGTMEIMALDDMLQQDIKVMKIDVEGFEPQVIKGMAKLLDTHKVWYIMLEYNKYLLDLNKEPSQQRGDFVRELMKRGYKCSDQGFQGPFLSTAQFLALDAAAQPDNSNFYFVRE